MTTVPPVNEHRLRLLVVSDDPELHDTLRDDMRQLRVGADLHLVPAAPAAIAFLRREGTYAGAQPPDLVVLDLDLADAGEVLDHLSGSADLERLPVVPLARDQPTAIADLGDQRVHEILSKPLERDELKRVLSYLDEV
jgi:chemotaxis family two-component system response regulator Rcp1